MKFLLLCIIVSLIGLLSAEIRQYEGKNVIPGQYIIKLRDGVQSRDFVNSRLLRTNNRVLTPLKNSVRFTYEAVFQGFSAKLDENQLQELDSMPEVELIESDAIVTINGLVTQTGSPWGLARVSTRSKLDSGNTNYGYTYDSTAGSGVTVYVIDTGVQLNHTEFGGRASFGTNTVGDGSNDDLNGHGTHVSGTIAGTQYGIAKSASIVAVKVLGADGSGAVSGIVAGINWVVSNCAQKSKCVINMSLGGLTLTIGTSVNTAVANAVTAGITTVVAAGNSNAPACLYSPAGEPKAITVAASAIDDTAASFTNFGSCVDVWAPGVDIKSAWIGSTTATNTISGTSMASPHVAGLAAYFISLYGLSTPDQVEAKIKDLCTQNAINIPLLMPLTPNKLIFNGVSVI